METTLVAFTFLILALSAQAAPPAAVLDIDNNKLKTGTEYYILPIIWGLGGGLTLASIRNKTCPLNVVQEQFEVSNGLPVTFSPVNVTSSGVIVPVSTNMNIRFSASSICGESLIWKLDSYDEATGQYFIASNGVAGNPGNETISSWFKIEEYGAYYKLVFCPTVCNYCKVICRDIGIYIIDGKRALALSDVPFMVLFKKA